MKKLILAALFFASSSAQASVYVAAHADDVELFMNESASTDVYHGARVVFILTSAGDNGYGAGLGGNTLGIPYYRARLMAHERAIRFWISLSGAHGVPTTDSTMSVRGHQLERADIANVSIINLNLPDGAAADGKTLGALLAGRVSTLTSVDGRNTFTLADLKATIREIISTTHRGVNPVWVNFQNEDASINLDDHGDHIATGSIVATALSEAPSYACVGKVRYLDYVIGTLPENMTVAERNIHIGTWGAVNSGLFDAGNQNNWADNHNVWLGRQYATGQNGSGSCNF